MGDFLRLEFKPETIPGHQPGLPKAVDTVVEWLMCAGQRFEHLHFDAVLRVSGRHCCPVSNFLETAVCFLACLPSFLLSCILKKELVVIFYDFGCSCL